MGGFKEELSLQLSPAGGIGFKLLKGNGDQQGRKVEASKIDWAVWTGSGAGEHSKMSYEAPSPFAQFLSQADLYPLLTAQRTEAEGRRNLSLHPGSPLALFV